MQRNFIFSIKEKKQLLATYYLKNPPLLAIHHWILFCMFPTWFSIREISSHPRSARIFSFSRSFDFTSALLMTCLIIISSKSLSSFLFSVFALIPSCLVFPSQSTAGNYRQPLTAPFSLMFVENESSTRENKPTTSGRNSCKSGSSIKFM